MPLPRGAPASLSTCAIIASRMPTTTTPANNNNNPRCSTWCHPTGPFPCLQRCAPPCASTPRWDGEVPACLLDLPSMQLASRDRHPHSWSPRIHTKNALMGMPCAAQLCRSPLLPAGFFVGNGVEMFRVWPHPTACLILSLPARCMQALLLQVVPYSSIAFTTFAELDSRSLALSASAPWPHHLSKLVMQASPRASSTMRFQVGSYRAKPHGAPPDIRIYCRSHSLARSSCPFALVHGVSCVAFSGAFAPFSTPGWPSAFASASSLCVHPFHTAVP